MGYIHGVCCFNLKPPVYMLSICSKDYVALCPGLVRCRYYNQSYTPLHRIEFGTDQGKHLISDVFN